MISQNNGLSVLWNLHLDAEKAFMVIKSYHSYLVS